MPFCNDILDLEGLYEISHVFISFNGFLKHWDGSQNHLKWIIRNLWVLPVWQPCLIPFRFLNDQNYGVRGSHHPGYRVHTKDG